MLSRKQRTHAFEIATTFTMNKHHHHQQHHLTQNIPIKVTADDCNRKRCREHQTL